jgi:hypothetical protein
MRVLKYEVPLDDNWHEIGFGNVVLVGAKDKYVAYVWVLVDEEQKRTEAVMGIPKTYRMARVFGTGQDVPGSWPHIGSYVNEPFVWHLFSVVRKDKDE